MKKNLLNICSNFWLFLILLVPIIFIISIFKDLKIFNVSDIINSNYSIKIIFLITVFVLMIFIWFSLFVLIYYSKKDLSQYTGFQKYLLEQTKKIQENKSIYVVYFVFGIATIGFIANIINLFK